MVYEELCIDPKQFIKQLLVMIIMDTAKGAGCDVPHGIEALGRKSALIAPAYAPEICKGPMVPKEPAVAELIKLRYPDAVSIRLHMLRHYIHGYLAEVEIGTYPCRGRDTRSCYDFPYELHGKSPRIKAIAPEIRRRIYKYLIHRIHIYILRSDVLKVYLIYLGTLFYIKSHLRRGCYEIHRLFRIREQLLPVIGTSRKQSAAKPHGPVGIELPYLLNDLKEPRPSGHAKGLKGRRYRKAYGLFGPLGIGHHQIGLKGVQSPLHTLHRSVK